MTNLLPNPTLQSFTVGVRTKQQLQDHQSDLWAEVIRQYRLQPIESKNGGNDKYFFSFIFYGVKLFVAANEVNGLTVMLPEEY